jgi:c-di-GMP-binding flagellar brake protein YcgR
MATEEKRKFYRVDTLNLLNYTVYDSTEQVIMQGMGRTLNVSETGILLETHVALKTGHSVRLTIGLAEDLIEIEGSVVYSKPGRENRYESGIQFTRIDDSGKENLTAFIQALGRNVGQPR